MPDNTIKTEILVHDLKVPVSVIDAGAKSGLDVSGLTVEAIRTEAPNLTVQQALDFVKAMESGDEAKKLKVAQQIGLA